MTRMTGRAMIEDKDYAGLLYATPSYLDGFARILDIGGTLDDYNYSATPEDSDRIAFLADWHAVASDFRKAVAETAKRFGLPSPGSR